MKQDIPTAESKTPTFQHSPVHVARERVLRTKDSSRLDSPNGSSKPDSSSRIRRSIFSSKPKEKEMEEPKIVDKPRTRTIEQHARVRRHVDTNRKGSDYQNDGRVKDDLERRLSVSESMVKELKSEVLTLEAQLEKLKSRNVLLESQNKQLVRDLSSAEAKIKALEKCDQNKQFIREFTSAEATEAKITALEKCDQAQHTSKEIQPSEFKDVRALIANKLDLRPVKRGVFKGEKVSKLPYLDISPKVQLTVPSPSFQTPPVIGPPPPPPPLPPPRSVPSRSNTAQKATSLVEFYHSITKRKEKGDFGSVNCASPVVNKAHNSIVDELQNRSSHLLAIKADVEMKGDFINNLIHEVQSAAFTDIEDVLTFVDGLDCQLSTLADERAVLKHFNWPERKADALREAAFEYRDLKRLVVDVSSFEDNVSLSCEATLKKITDFLDKSERSVQRLIKLRDTNMRSYKDGKIPIDWMFDSGMVSKIKQATAKLAKVYIKRVSTELELARHAERESVHEALLLQGVRFAYRAYQFGGLDSETMRAFEEFRDRVQLHRRGSRDLLPLT